MLEEGIKGLMNHKIVQKHNTIKSSNQLLIYA